MPQYYITHTLHIWFTNNHSKFYCSLLCLWWNKIFNTKLLNKTMKWWFATCLYNTLLFPMQLFFLCLTLKKMHYDPPKCQELLAQWNNITFLKTGNFVFSFMLLAYHQLYFHIPLSCIVYEWITKIRNPILQIMFFSVKSIAKYQCVTSMSRLPLALSILTKVLLALHSFLR